VGDIVLPVYLAGFGGAVFSQDLRHRYELSRVIDHGMFSRPEPKTALFVMLNPSTADHENNDPTIRRCIGFAKAWHCTALEIRNLFSLRSTDPRALYSDAQAEGDPQNIGRIVSASTTADIIVCAWGSHGALRDRDAFVRETLRGSGRRLYHLGLTQRGQPRHPLYLRGDTKPMEWT